MNNDWKLLGSFLIASVGASLVSSHIDKLVVLGNEIWIVLGVGMVIGSIYFGVIK